MLAMLTKHFTAMHSGDMDNLKYQFSMEDRPHSTDERIEKKLI